MKVYLRRYVPIYHSLIGLRLRPHTQCPVGYLHSKYYNVCYNSTTFSLVAFALGNAWAQAPASSATAGNPQKVVRQNLWGGDCDTQRVLPLGTPAEVREHVQHNLGVFTSGTGGYVFNQVHNI
jgi:hypothetical protein